MATARPITIATVIEYLEKPQSQEVKFVDIGAGRAKQTLPIVDGNIVDLDEQGHVILPQADGQTLKSLVTKLGLKEADLVNAQSSVKGQTLLIAATLQGNLSLVQALLDHGADPSLVDSDKESAIMHAARLGHTDILKEFMTLFDGGEKKHSNQPASGEQKESANKEGAAAGSSKATAVSSENDPLKVPRRGPDQNSQRVRLDPAIMAATNLKGETAEALIQQCINHPSPNASEVKDQKASPTKKKPKKDAHPLPKNSVDSFKALLDELHARNEKVSKKAAAKKTPVKDLEIDAKATEVRKEAQEALRVTNLESGIQANKIGALKRYDKFYSGKKALFFRACQNLERQDLVRLQAFEARERLRNSYGVYILPLKKGQDLPSRAALEEISAQVYYDPILIIRQYNPDLKPDLELEEFSVYGCNPGWTLTTLSSQQAEVFKQGLAYTRLRSVLERQPGQAVHIPSNDPQLADRSSVKQLVGLYHKPKLNQKKVIHFDEVKQLSDLPLSAEDQAKVRAALNILRDYYAPESAPLPHSWQWGWVRRLFTVHLGRRYTERAERLRKSQSLASIQSVQDVMTIHTQINAELEAILLLPHGQDGMNTIFNSSYARRLTYILDVLKKTSAYVHVDQGLDNNDYLNTLDLGFKG